LRNSKFKHFKDEELVCLFIETQRNIYFEELYERYVNKVYRKCYSFVYDQSLAEDFTHDIFLKLVLKISSYKENSRFSTWLFSITYNYCMDQVRIGKKQGEVAIEEGFDKEEEVEDHELINMQGQELKKSLDQISPDEKALLLMKYQDDFSIKDIANTFKISESAVKMRLMRTKEKIKRLYFENIAVVALLILKIILFWKK